MLFLFMAGSIITHIAAASFWLVSRLWSNNVEIQFSIILLAEKMASWEIDRADKFMRFFLDLLFSVDLFNSCATLCFSPETYFYTQILVRWLFSLVKFYFESDFMVVKFLWLCILIKLLMKPGSTHVAEHYDALRESTFPTASLEAWGWWF